MKIILNAVLFILFSINLIFAADPAYSNYDIDLSLTITEAALDQFIRIQAFPEPEGTHTSGSDTYSYSVSVIQPDIDLTPGTVTFNSAINASVTLAGTTVKYSYPVSVSVSIPSGSVSVNGIIGFLEDIPAEINNSGIGPQWLRNIIVNAYKDLELSLYPKKLMDEINAQIPDDLDIVINDLQISWQVTNGSFDMTVTVPSSSRAPFVKLKNLSLSSGADNLRCTLQSNVKLRIIAFDVYNSLGSPVAHGQSNLIIPAPAIGEEYGEITLSVSSDNGSNFTSQYYIVSVILGNGYTYFVKNFPKSFAN